MHNEFLLGIPRPVQTRASDRKRNDVGTRKGMTTEKTSPFAKASLTLAVLALVVTLLSATFMLVPIQTANGLPLFATLAVCGLNVYVLGPLTLITMLIAIAHKAITRCEYKMWRGLGISFLMACVALFGSVWLARTMMDRAM